MNETWIIVDQIGNDTLSGKPQPTCHIRDPGISHLSRQQPAGPMYSIGEGTNRALRILVKHGRKINRTYAYWLTKGALIAIFLKQQIANGLSFFDAQAKANTAIARLDISNRRKKKPPRLYYMN